MRTSRFLILFALTLLLTAAFAHGQVRILKNVEPVFPPGADDVIYGDVVPVIVSVDPRGKVTDAITLGPHVPCSKRNDKIAKAITTAILTAARATVYSPTVENNNPVEASFLVNYKLPGKNPAVRVEKNGVKVKPPHSYPEFPPIARERGIEGEAQVSVLIDETGKVISAAPRSGPAEFRPAAIDAACRARFERPASKTLYMLEYSWSIG